MDKRPNIFCPGPVFQMIGLAGGVSCANCAQSPLVLLVILVEKDAAGD